jgi:L-seryl-tRNA(Ser) seleniumtransferase
LNKSKDEIKNTAELLKNKLQEKQIDSKIVKSKGKYGGGTLPDLEIDSFSLELLPCNNKNTLAKKMYHSLLEQKFPILSNLKSGKIFFDVLTIQDVDIEQISETIKSAYQESYLNK